jgi:hypothetical protein
MSINSRPGDETRQKIDMSSPTRYRALKMTDESVYDMARHWYTMEEVADRFNVTRSTVEALHGDAFREGKANGFQKPRMLLNKILSDFADETDGGLNFARPDIPVHNLLKAIELHAKKYEGMGSKSTIVHEGKVTYDAVDSAPTIIERPE